MWVNEYLLEVHRETRGLEIIADIDHRYVLFLPSHPKFIQSNTIH